jgi:hypothetical protein
MRLKENVLGNTAQLGSSQLMRINPRVVHVDRIILNSQSEHEGLIAEESPFGSAKDRIAEPCVSLATADCVDKPANLSSTN